jgi:hypothetical protein
MGGESSHRGGATAPGVRQQQRPAASRGSIRRTAVVLADDRFDRADGPERACAYAAKQSSAPLVVADPGRGPWFAGAVSPASSRLTLG